MNREREHGTYAGYQQHRRRRETPCDDCRRASADYIAAHRKANRKRHLEMSRAAGRALQALKEAHRDEYERYYANELTFQRIGRPS